MFAFIIVFNSIANVLRQMPCKSETAVDDLLSFLKKLYYWLYDSTFYKSSYHFCTIFPSYSLNLDAVAYFY